MSFFFLFPHQGEFSSFFQELSGFSFSLVFKIRSMFAISFYKGPLLSFSEALRQMMFFSFLKEVIAPFPPLVIFVDQRRFYDIFSPRFTAPLCLLMGRPPTTFLSMSRRRSNSWSFFCVLQRYVFFPCFVYKAFPFMRLPISGGRDPSVFFCSGVKAKPLTCSFPWEIFISVSPLGGEVPP